MANSMWEQTPTTQDWRSCREGREGLGKGSMGEKEMWVREGAGKAEAKAGGGREAGKVEERARQREERKLGQEKQEVLLKTLPITIYHAEVLKIKY